MCSFTHFQVKFPYKTKPVMSEEERDSVNMVNKCKYGKHGFNAKAFSKICSWKTKQQQKRL